MKKPCPDLVHLDDEGLTDFWKRHRPDELRSLGDRLLAESLPRFPARNEAFYLENLAAEREKHHFDLEKMAGLLDVNPTVLQAWESGEVRPPASLALIYKTLG